MNCRFLPSLLIVGGLLGAVAPASAAEVPAKLQPTPGEKRLLSVHARGVQIYECTSSSTSTTAVAAPAWAFVAPEAELFDSAASNTPVGTHGAGPFWQWADGSKVVGKVKERSDAPLSGAIPWLLLSTTPAGGPGRLAAVTSVQRINTAGGVAPASGCAAPADLGQRVRVPYTSDYVFFTAGP